MYLRRLSSSWAILGGNGCTWSRIGYATDAVVGSTQLMIVASMWLGLGSFKFIICHFNQIVLKYIGFYNWREINIVKIILAFKNTLVIENSMF